MLTMSLRLIKEQHPTARMYLLFNRRLQKRFDATQSVMRRLLEQDPTSSDWQLLGIIP